MSRMYSIDCGLKGGISCFINGKFKYSVPMPTIDNKKKELDGKEILRVMECADKIIIEKQFIPKNKPQAGTVTNIGNFGAIKVLSRMLTGNIIIVDSKVWKAYFNLSNTGRSPLLPKITKKDSVNLANSTLGTQYELKHDGEAESALIGLWSIKNER